MEKKEIIALKKEIEKLNAEMKKGYWETAGTAILSGDGLSEKWCYFVQEQVKDEFSRGMLLDETLQIMTMIKANIPYEVIAQTINQIPNGQTIIDSYLGAFIHPEILYEIQTIIDAKKSNRR